MKLGRSHALIRRIRSLRRDAKLRRSEGLLVAEGLHLADEALAAGAEIERVVVSAELGERPGGRRLLQRIEAAGLTCHETSPELLRSVQDARSPQPVLMLVRRPSWSLEECLHAGPQTVLVGHSIQDPGNLGTMLRTAAASGAELLLASGDCADLYHPRTVRAGMGATFRLPALTGKAGELLDRLGEHGLRRVGAEPRAGLSYLDCDLSPPTALVLGGEGAGLPGEIRERLDAEVSIPMRRGVDSLSVGAAAAVLLFEATRQRGAASGSAG